MSQSAPEPSSTGHAQTAGLGTRIQAMFTGLGGLELPECPTDEARAADFS